MKLPLTTVLLLWKQIKSTLIVNKVTAWYRNEVLHLKKYLDCIYKRISTINYSTFGFDQKPEHDFVMLCLNELLMLQWTLDTVSSVNFRVVIILCFFPIFDQWTNFNVKSIWISSVHKNVYINQKLCIAIILYSKVECSLNQCIIHKARTSGKTKLCTSFKAVKLLKHTIFMHAISDCVFLKTQACFRQIKICQKFHTKQFLLIIKAIINPRIVIHFILSLHQKKVIQKNF